MRQVFICGFAALLFASSTVISQVPVPKPIADAEMRDGSSLRRRALELERVKQEANQYHPKESTEEAAIKFAEIKDDFENIQKLQSLIVKAYIYGEKINYEKIRESANKIRKKATRLEMNFFNTSAETNADKNKNVQNPPQTSVRNLIIELDRTIGNFVASPVFKTGSIVNSKVMEKSQFDLEKIVKLSDELSRIE